MGNVSHVKKLEEATDQLLKVWEYLNEPEKEVEVSNITYFNKSLKITFSNDDEKELADNCKDLEAKFYM
jgi:hypothetical protein